MRQASTWRAYPCTLLQYLLRPSFPWHVPRCPSVCWVDVPLHAGQCISVCWTELHPSYPCREGELSVDDEPNRNEAAGLLAGSPFLRSAVRNARHRRRELTRENGQTLDEMLREIWPEVHEETGPPDPSAGASGQHISSPITAPRISSIKAPLQAAGAAVRLWQPVLDLSRLPWNELARAQPSKPQQVARGSSAAININSGGIVFFLLFRRRGLFPNDDDDDSSETLLRPPGSSPVGPGGWSTDTGASIEVEADAWGATSPVSPSRFTSGSRRETACVLKVYDSSLAACY